MGATEEEMVEWHHQLHGHEFEQALGDGEGITFSFLLAIISALPWLKHIF